ncbi:MAG: hypothetical protein KKF62_13485 [Bacteroidetes bacterium]|nr:hypothetical protein [Bacteroidota bacterium]MBU1115528.1 hypothetical protein [Bacteroidota bacterium]MBU1799580.1 hypothetical protein [Bacteroidota bacterium]
MKYKNGQLFWGFLFLTIGTLFLLDKNDYSLFIPDSIINYWPILIILWGVAILLKGTVIKPIVSVISGIFVGLFLYGSIFGFNHISYNYSDKEVTTSDFYEDYKDSTKNATLSIRTGIGKISVAGSTDKLISGSSSGVYNTFNFKTRYRNDNARIVLRHTKDEIELFGDNNYSNVEFSLNQNPVWNIDLQVGAAKVKMDLSEYKVAEFNLETGASTSDLKFGNKEENLKLNVQMGAATLNIHIPRESGCQIKGDMVLVVKDLEGFSEIDDKHFQTENFNNATNKIFINFDGGVSTLKIDRY